jgi:hypothetical protein
MSQNGSGKNAVRRVLPLGPPAISRTVAYAASPLIVLTAALLQHEVLPPPSVDPFLFFYLAVTVAAWLGGLGPGLIAVVLSAVLGNIFSSRGQPRVGHRRTGRQTKKGGKGESSFADVFPCHHCPRIFHEVFLSLHSIHHNLH